MPDQPNFQFPRWYPMRGGGHYGGNAASAISAFGDDLSGVLAGFAQRAQQKKQDELANALMNNGQSPGAAPYVRRATYPDGDQGDDPGPVPFDSTDTPYSGGEDMAARLAGQAQMQQKAQQQALANSLAGRRLDLQGQRLSMGNKGRPMSDYEQYGIDNPTFVPPSQRRQFAPSKGKKSNMLPPSLGDDNLPTNEPAMPAPTGAAPAAGSPLMDMLGGLYNKAMGALPSGSPAGAPPDASPSATPLIAQRPDGDPIAAGRAIKADPSLSKEEKLSKLRALGFK